MIVFGFLLVAFGILLTWASLKQTLAIDLLSSLIGGAPGTATQPQPIASRPGQRA